MNLREQICQHNRIDDYCDRIVAQDNPSYQAFLGEVLAMEPSLLQDWLWDDNATLVAYAFWALLIKRQIDAESFLLAQQADTRQVYYCSAGEYQNMNLIKFMLDIAIQESMRQNREVLSEQSILLLRR